MDVRCGAKLHGILDGGDVLEIKCSSRFCGARPGTVVLHRFSTMTGELIETLTYKDPRKEQADASQHHPASVRTA